MTQYEVRMSQKTRHLEVGHNLYTTVFPLNTEVRNESTIYIATSWLKTLPSDDYIATVVGLTTIEGRIQKDVHR